MGTVNDALSFGYTFIVLTVQFEDGIKNYFKNNNVSMAGWPSRGWTIHILNMKIIERYLLSMHILLYQENKLEIWSFQHESDSSHCHSLCCRVYHSLNYKHHMGTYHEQPASHGQ